MTDLPRLAISIRQPWAWAIVHAGKDIENRDWPTRFRGPVCIHAAIAAMLDGVTEGQIERQIWAAMVWAARQPAPPYGAGYPNYTDNGNSDAESVARNAADSIRSIVSTERDRLAEENDRLRAALARFEAMSMVDFANYLTTKSMDAIRAMKGGAK